MEKFTQDFIFGLKNNDDKTYVEAATTVMSQLTNTPAEYYNENNLTEIAIQKFTDFLTTADNPSYEVHEYFHRHFNEGKSMLDSILATLMLVQVRKNGEYVNGFKF